MGIAGGHLGPGHKVSAEVNCHAAMATYRIKQLIIGEPAEDSFSMYIIPTCNAVHAAFMSGCYTVGNVSVG